MYKNIRSYIRLHIAIGNACRAGCAGLPEGFAEDEFFRAWSAAAVIARIERARFEGLAKIKTAPNTESLRCQI